MNLTNTMAGIDANLDDLQSGVEACSRVVDTIQSELSEMSQHNGGVKSLARRTAELHVCARDQQGALRELRENVARLKLLLTTVTP